MLPIEERIEVYKKMYDYYSKYNTPGVGFCWLIELKFKPFTNIQDYPELMSYKPIDSSNGYWWSKHDKETRRTVLLKIIENAKV